MAVVVIGVGSVTSATPPAALLVGLLAGGSAAAGQSLPSRNGGPACNAALSLVKRTTSRQIDGRPWVVADSPASEGGPTAFDRKEQEFLSQPWQGEKPTKRLARVFVASHPTSALKTCPEIVAYLDGVGIKHGDAAAHEAALDPATGRPMLPFYPRTILSLSLPVVSHDGRDAVIEVGIVGGGLSGAGSIHHLHEQPDGEWTDVGELQTWIA